MDENSIPCANCKLRAKYDNNPKSLAGRFWRWHIGFCPGWKRYMNSISEKERLTYIEKYKLKKACFPATPAKAVRQRHCKNL